MKKNDIHAPRPRLDFAWQFFKHGPILKRSPSPYSKWEHQILKFNYWNIAGRTITTIITIIIIILVTIIIDQITTSIFRTQVKLSFNSNTFPIIFISITVNHQQHPSSWNVRVFSLILQLLHQNFCSSIYILPSSCTSSSIKSTTWNSRFFFTCCATCYWRSANNTSCRTSRGVWICSQRRQ